MSKLLRTILAFSIAYFSFQLTALAQICASPGKEGPATSNATMLNTYYAGSGAVSVGATSISLVQSPSAGSTVPIGIGDLVLIIQMQGADINTSNNTSYGAGTTSANGNLDNAAFTAGQYEYAIAASNVPVTGGTLALTGGTINSYANANFGTTGQRRFQVVRIPQYASLTLSASVIALDWNGATGGIVALDVAGRLNFNGFTINATGAGFRGGAGRTLTGTTATGYAYTDFRTPSTIAINAQKGEGTAGTPTFVFNGTASINTGVEGYLAGSSGRGAPGNAGGGGTDGRPSANDQNSGGGGGANGGAGGTGGNAWESSYAVGGRGGAVFGKVSTGRLILGGGGGAGTTNNGSGTPANGLASSGAAGGGIVMVRTGTITGTGSILANGDNANTTVTNDGSGGGGAGGSILVTVKSGDLSTITLNARGGNGGSNTGGGTPHGPGGGGGGGVIYANAATGARNVSAGVNGTTSTGAFGAVAGTTGIVNITVSPAIANSASGADCLPLINVIKEAASPLAYRLAGGTTATYTIEATNTGGAAMGMRIGDKLPTGFTFKSTISIGAEGPVSAYYDNGGNITASNTRVTVLNPTTLAPAAGTTTPEWGTFYIPSGVTVRITFEVDIAAGVATNTIQNNTAYAYYLDPTRISATRLITMDTQYAPSNYTYESGAAATADVAGSNYNGATGTTDDVTVKLPVDVAITNTVAAGPYFAGKPVTYTIIARNNSSDPATGVTITDLLPAGLIFNSASATTGTYTSGSGIWNIGTIPANSSVTLTLTATPTAAGSITTTATKSAQTEPDEVTTNNTASNTITVAAAADIAVTNTVVAGPYYNGVNTAFTVTARNNGANNATGLTIKDLLPAGLQFVSATPSVGTFNSTTGIWTIGNLANSLSATLNLVVKPITTGILQTTASVEQVNEFDNNSANNTATQSITVNAAAELEITNKLVAGGQFRGQETTYEVIVKNNGPDNATGVIVTDKLPADLTFIAATAPAGTTYDSATGVWTIGNLANGASTKLTLVARPVTTNAHTTTASITSSGQYDPVSANNTASNTIYPSPSADIQVTNSIAAGPHYNGVNTTLTIQAKNNGPSNATGLSLNGQLPAGFTYVSHTLSTGVMSADGTWTIGNLAANATATVTIVVKPNTTGSISMTASKATLNENDPNLTNDQATVTINALPAADIAVTNTISAGPYQVNSDVTYTVTAFNRGPNAATGVVITGKLPAGLTFKSASPTSGTYNNLTGEWTIGGLAVGASSTLTLVATPITTNTLTTRAYVSAAGVHDAIVSNNSASNSIKPGAQPVADINILNTAAAGPYYNKVQTTFTVTAENIGPDAASDVVVSYTLPAGLTLVNAVPEVGSYADGIWNIGSIAAGTTTTLTLVVEPTVIGNLTTTATKTGQSVNEIDNVPANDTDSVTITVLENADVQVKLQVTQGPHYVGDYPVFKAIVTNNGPNTANNLVIFDGRPGAFDISTLIVSPSSGTYDRLSGNWTIPSLASGASAEITLTGKLIRSGAITLSVSKTSQTEHDAVGGNNAEFATIIVSPSADMSVTNVASKKTVLNGEEFTFTVTAANAGPSPETGVQITDLLPANVTLVKAVASGGSYNAATGIWSIDNIGVNGSETLVLTVKPTQTGTITSTATKTTANEYDKNSANNSSTETVTVTASADVAATFSVSEGPYYRGVTEITFTGTVKNNGPDAATNVVYFDNRASDGTRNFDIENVVTSHGTYDSNTGYWTIGTIPVGTIATITIKATPLTAGNIPIAVSKTSQGEIDPVTANNTASVFVNVEKAADIALSSSQAAAPYFINQQTTYTVTATNNGIDDATSVAVTHQLPTGLKLISATPATGTYDAASGIWTIGNLAKASSTTITFVINPIATGAQVASATKSSAMEFDERSDNNTVNTTFVVSVDQKAVYEVAPARNIDTYVNGQSLATVTDADGAITSAILSTGVLPAGVALNGVTGQLTVTNRNLLVPGTYPLSITTTDAKGGKSTNNIELIINNDTEAYYTIAPALNFYDYLNMKVMATATDAGGAITSATLISGTLPGGTQLNADGSIVVTNRLLIRPGEYPVSIRTVDANGGISEQSITLLITQDRDGDGVSDFEDIDNNNDGIPDYISQRGVNPFELSNGTYKYIDPAFVHPYYGAFKDTNKDGINDWFDLDLDGIINSLDSDMDGDGIANTIEANNGLVPEHFNLNTSKMLGTVGTNGMPNFAETASNSGQSIFQMNDNDGDGHPDFIDLDSDNDGITDNIEAQTTEGYSAPSGLDVNRDGMDDRYDGQLSGTLIIPINTDSLYEISDLIPDYLDLDSDNDKVGDYYEAFMPNTNGSTLDDLLARASAFETRAGKPNKYSNADVNGYKDADGTPDWLEIGINQLRPNFLNATTGYFYDTDRDGVVDLFDTDNFGTVLNPALKDGVANFRTREMITPLPVELIRFTAVAQQDNVVLNWSTASEVNNAYFILERSQDGINFTKLGQVAGAGNSNKLQNYTFLDQQPLPGTSYYRLKQVDTNATFKYSKLVSVTRNNEVQLVQFYPNPAVANVAASFTAHEDEKAMVLVQDMKGRTVKSVHVNILKGVNKIDINLTDLASGVYIISIKSAKMEITHKIVKTTL